MQSLLVYVKNACPYAILSGTPQKRAQTPLAITTCLKSFCFISPASLQVSCHPHLASSSAFTRVTAITSQERWRCGRRPSAKCSRYRQTSVAFGKVSASWGQGKSEKAQVYLDRFVRRDSQTFPSAGRQRPPTSALFSKTLGLLIRKFPNKARNLKKRDIECMAYDEGPTPGGAPNTLNPMKPYKPETLNRINPKP